MIGTAIIIGIVTLLISGIRPQFRKIWSPVLALVILFSGSMIIIFSGNIEFPIDKIDGSGINNQVQLVEPTKTEVLVVLNTADVTLTASTNSVEDKRVTATIIPTLLPTITPTITLTPLPTPVWAEIQAGESNGANVRSEPGFSGKIILSVLNGTLVEILPDVAIEDGITWTKIKFPDQTEGWIVRTLLLSATPAPEW